MRSTIYLPILKGKQGEFGALRALRTQQGLSPLIEIPKVKWDFANDRPSRSVHEHATKFIRALGKARPSCDHVLLDAGLLADEGPDADAHVLEEALARFAENQMPLIPVTGFERAPRYQQVTRDAARRDATGCCIRLEREDMSDPLALKGNLSDLLVLLRLDARQVDLVIDMKGLKENQETSDLKWVQATFAEIPLLTEWRSLWLSGSAFPEFLTEVGADAEAYLPRVEWTLWSTLLRGGHFRVRAPRFSDYAIAHPAAVDIDGRTMRMSANLRYTAEHHWVVLRGRNVRDYGYRQFNSLCQKMVTRKEYQGGHFSWGDAYINACAHDTSGPGNASTWRKVGSSHHFEFALRQIDGLKRLIS